MQKADNAFVLPEKVNSKVSKRQTNEELVLRNKDLGINLGAEHDPHERVSNERVRFPSMLLKLTTTAIVLNKGIVFNEEHFIRHCLQLVGTMIIICRAAFGQFYYCFETYLQALRVLTACTWAPLPPQSHSTLSASTLLLSEPVSGSQVLPPCV